ncbi:sporulation-specific protein spo7 [Podospora conica]|nr:sporulation-specific protein spo7 [Schizothecium conicum]
MADPLDSIVKGAPMALPGQDLPKSVGGTTPIAPMPASASTAFKTGDPLSHTPSSPSMIYLNLLILEASLRAQYLELRARRRHHTFFLSLLSLWMLGFGYALFLAPREDGSGVGGSVYWMVESTERLCFLGGVITALLVWATGIWERGVRWPRRWFAVANRGLRGFNCKLVVMKRPWWREALATTGWFLTYGLFSKSAGSSYRYVDPQVLREVDRELGITTQNHPVLPAVNTGLDEEKGGHEEDLAAGGDYVKLLLLAKPFSPTFRENWELYRTEYWDRENERRALLRVKLAERDKRVRREQGGWFWWLPWGRAVEKKAAVAAPRVDEKLHRPRHSAVMGEHKRTRSNSTRRASMSTGSRSATPAPTPTLEVDEAGVMRKASTASNASDKKRKKLVPAGKGRPRVESRSVTPDNPSPLGREASTGSTPPTFLIPMPAVSGATATASVSLRDTSLSSAIASLLGLTQSQYLTITNNNALQRCGQVTSHQWSYSERHKAHPILDFLSLGPASVARTPNFLVDEAITMVLAVRDARFPNAFQGALDAARNAGIAAQSVLVDQQEPGFGLARLHLEFAKLINEHMLAVAGPAARYPGQRGRVLVVCETGNDRSVLMVLSYLMAMYGVGVVDAVRLLQAQRFCANIQDPYRLALQTLEELMRAKLDVVAAQPGPQGMVARGGRGGKRANKKRAADENGSDEEMGGGSRPGNAPYVDHGDLDME